MDPMVVVLLMVVVVLLMVVVVMVVVMGVRYKNVPQHQGAPRYTTFKKNQEND